MHSDNPYIPPSTEQEERRHRVAISWVASAAVMMLLIAVGVFYLRSVRLAYRAERAAQAAQQAAVQAAEQAAASTADVAEPSPWQVEEVNDNTTRNGKLTLR